MTDKKLIRILENIAILLDIKGENPFKSRAYSNAAQTIEEENINVHDSVRMNTLKDIKGFGEALQKKITEFVETGSMLYYEKLITEIPESLVDITKISNIGPKKAKLLWEQFNISNIDDLQEICENGKIDNIKGFSSKSRELILNSIYHKKASKGKHIQELAVDEGIGILDFIKSQKNVINADIAGGMRRFEETTKEIVIVAASDSPDDLVKGLKEKYDLSVNGNILEFLSYNKIPVKVYICIERDYAILLLKETGSEEFYNTLTLYSQKQGINQDQPALSEMEIFVNLSMQFIEPELRETGKIIESAIKNEIPELIGMNDMKGMLHVHSNWSDGKHTIEEMALSAKELGYQYIAICDHSRSAGYANGLSIERVREQHNEIDRLNDEIDGIFILKGIESDILNDGSLDYPDSVLESFDLVVASVHSNFSMNKFDMTRRLIYALMSPFTTILGHPTGRLLLARQPYELDINDVIDAAVEYGKVIEINSNPYRLDLSWQDSIYAKSKGMKFAINPDSHRKDTLTDVYYGIKTARKAMLTKDDVINTLNLDDFRKYINKYNG